MRDAKPRAAQEPDGHVAVGLMAKPQPGQLHESGTQTGVGPSAYPSAPLSGAACAGRVHKPCGGIDLVDGEERLVVQLVCENPGEPVAYPLDAQEFGENVIHVSWSSPLDGMSAEHWLWGMSMARLLPFLSMAFLCPLTHLAFLLRYYTSVFPVLPLVFHQLALHFFRQRSAQAVRQGTHVCLLHG